jgi:hypothetical protein
MILTGLDPRGLVQSVYAELGLNPAIVIPEGYEVSDFSNRVLKFLFSTSNKFGIWKGIRL